MSIISAGRNLLKTQVKAASKSKTLKRAGIVAGGTALGVGGVALGSATGGNKTSYTNNGTVYQIPTTAATEQGGGGFFDEPIVDSSGNLNASGVLKWGLLIGGGVAVAYAISKGVSNGKK